MYVGLPSRYISPLFNLGQKSFILHWISEFHLNIQDEYIQDKTAEESVSMSALLGGKAGSICAKQGRTEADICKLAAHQTAWVQEAWLYLCVSCAGAKSCWAVAGESCSTILPCMDFLQVHSSVGWLTAWSMFDQCVASGNPLVFGFPSGYQQDLNPMHK